MRSILQHHLLRKIIHIICLLGPVLATSQIVVDKGSLPDFGDTILYKTDRKPFIELGEGGEDQLWNFSQLTSPYSDEITFDSPDGESNDADILVQQNGKPLFLLHWYGSDLKLIGQYDPQLLLQGEPKASQFSKPGFFRNETFKYGDTFEEEYQETTVYSSNDVSFETLNSLTEIPDSIKVVRETAIFYEVDAWGSVILPMSKDDVLRFKIDRREVVNYISIKDGLETLIGNQNFLNQRIAPQEFRVISYHYYSELSKIPLIMVQTDDNGDIVQVAYQIDKSFFGDAKPFDERKGLAAYPNPSIGPVRFDFYGYPEGKYTIRVFNTILKTIWSETFTIDQNGVIDVDLGFLQKGTYVYAVDNENGERLLTKKLLIISP